MQHGLYPSSYYAAAASMPDPHPPLEGDAACDVCVVGGGYTGLSTALELAEKGFDVRLLEARRVGFGASGRNGGQLLPGLSPGAVEARRLLGPAHARALWDLSVEAVALVRRRIEEHAIACDLVPGSMIAAVKSGHLGGLDMEAALLRGEYGYDAVSRLDREAVRQILGSARYHGGLYDAGGGHLDPLRYCLGLARAAQAAGVRIHETTAVRAIEPGPRPVASTAGGRASADVIVLAGNAYLGGLVREISAKTLPVSTYMLATEPLGPERARSLIRNNSCVCDTTTPLSYYRLSADHRLLFGGRARVLATEPERLKRSLKRLMLETFPQLEDARIDYVWGGEVSVTRNKLPHIGQLSPNIYFAQGFAGHGVALSAIVGRLVAEAVAGTLGRFDLMARIPHRSIPGPWALRAPIVYAYEIYRRLRTLF